MKALECLNSLTSIREVTKQRRAISCTLFFTVSSLKNIEPLFRRQGEIREDCLLSPQFGFFIKDYKDRF